MHLLVSLVVLGMVAVNGFGAWAVGRRRPLVGYLFLVSAAILVVAAVAYAYRYPHAWWILLAGSVAAFVTSLLNARIVIGEVVWQNHLARAAYIAGALLLAAWLAPLG